MTKLARQGMSTLGRPVVDLGAGMPHQWTPRDYRYYDRQWKTQAGGWGDPDDAADRLNADTAAVVSAFQRRGTKAGLREARARGVEPGAQLYVRIRAETEDQLANRLARLRAAQVREPNIGNALREPFVAARLAEVRAAIAKGHTPDPAVLDMPDLPRTRPPHWVPVALLTLSALAFFRSLQ